MARINVGVLASGRGTDFQALVDAVEHGDLDVNIVLLICNNKNAPVIERAKRHGITWMYIDHRGRTRQEFEEEVAQALKAHNVDLVVFAGFMRLVTTHFIDQFRSRIINIHPSLLPSFPGAHAHRDALEHGVKVSGCTIHFVDESTDGGPIILQKAIEVKDGDTEETLSARILKQEHIFLPLAVKLFAEGRLRIVGRKVHIDTTGIELPPLA